MGLKVRPGADGCQDVVKAPATRGTRRDHQEAGAGSMRQNPGRSLKFLSAKGGRDARDNSARAPATLRHLLASERRSALDVTKQNDA